MFPRASLIFWPCIEAAGNGTDEGFSFLLLGQEPRQVLKQELGGRQETTKVSPSIVSHGNKSIYDRSGLGGGEDALSQTSQASCFLPSPVHLSLSRICNEMQVGGDVWVPGLGVEGVIASGRLEEACAVFSVPKIVLAISSPPRHQKKQLGGGDFQAEELECS